MLDRHPGLSERQAATQAGLANNTVTRIVSGQVLQPSPVTLERLSAKWGTVVDYYELMRLAGYKVPYPANVNSPQEAGLLETFRALPPAKQKTALRLIRALLEEND